MATIRQRGSRWQCRVRRLGIPDVNKSFSTREDAQKWARKIERQIDLETYSPVEHETMLLGDLLERYKIEVTPTKKGASQEIYRLGIIKADNLAKLTLKALTPALVAAFRERRLKTVKPVTVLHDLCTLSAVLEHARLEWSFPIANAVRAIRKPSIGRGRERRLEQNEEDILLQELLKCRNQWIAPMFLIALETTCRRGELVKVRWSDVDLHKRIAVLRDTKAGDDRVIPLSTKAVRILSSLPRSIDGRVFPVNPEGITHSFVLACKRGGIENLRWHDLRHEGVSRLFEKGLDTIEVSSISGHKTLACLKRYAHMKAERLAERLG